MAEITRIYLVRHGTTDWNSQSAKEEIFRGRVDCKLNETGKQEARALERYFRETHLDAVYSSPLSRAFETAEAVALPKGLEVRPDPAFIDMDFGEWQGLSVKSVMERYPELYRIWRERPQEAGFPAGETLRQVRSRTWERFQELARENRGRTLLIASHRVITKVLICAALGLDDSHFWQIKQDRTAVNCFEYTGRMFIASLMNDTCHLKSV